MNERDRGWIEREESANEERKVSQSSISTTRTESSPSNDDERAISETSTSRIPSTRSESNSIRPFFDVALVIRAGGEKSNSC
jgi:hypothetical protein